MSIHQVKKEIEEGLQNLNKCSKSLETPVSAIRCVKYRIIMGDVLSESPKQIIYWFDQNCCDDELKRSILNMINSIAEKYNINIISRPI